MSGYNEGYICDAVHMKPQAEWSFRERNARFTRICGSLCWGHFNIQKKTNRKQQHFVDKFIKCLNYFVSNLRRMSDN